MYGLFNFGLSPARAGTAVFGCTRDTNNNLIVTCTNNNPNGIKVLRVIEHSPTGDHQHVATSTNCPAVLGVTFTSVSKSSTFTALEWTCNGKGALQSFDSTLTPKSAVIAIGGGPGASQILIHQYATTDLEMTAFEAGSLDIDDWPVPDAYLAAWTGSDPARNIVTQGKATLWNHKDLGMFEVDVNSGICNPTFGNCATYLPSGFNPTSNKPLRQALSELLDRATIVLGYAGGRAIPICAATAPDQPGAMSCTRLGWPTSYGEFNPTKALQILYEGGWRDCGTGDGSLCLPPHAKQSITVISRTDDPIRLQMGQGLVNVLGNLPNHFTDKTTGLTVTVCTTSSCKINVNNTPLDRRAAGRIVFRGPNWFDWNLYTGGFSLGFEPDFLAFEFGSSQAPQSCGGAWVGDFPNNYDCYVDATYDTLAQPLVTGHSESDVVAAAQAVQPYAWGYDIAKGKPKGTIPDLPAYTSAATKAAWRSDYGPNPKLNTDGSRACWKGFTSQETGAGLDNYYTLLSESLYNCQETKPGYVSYRGQGTLDWGFKSTIQGLNPIESEWLWDFLAMFGTYENLLDRNPVNLPEIIPFMGVASEFGESTYFNPTLGKSGTVLSFKLQPDTFWSDGVPFTCQDVKFSLMYAKLNFSPLFFSNVEHLLDVQCVNKSDGSQTVLLFFDDIGALFKINVGGNPLIAQHVWCADWDGNDATHPIGAGVPARAGCPFPDMTLFDPVQFQGLGCPGCPAGPNMHVGLGPYIIDSCTGPGDCTDTITLKPNPFYHAGIRYWSQAAGISLNLDVNHDDQVNQADLQLLKDVDPNDPIFSPTYRITGKETWGPQTVPMSNFGNATLDKSVSVPATTLLGTHITDLDRYTIKRMLFEATQTGQTTGVPWPPGQRLTYTWPDGPNKDNDVDLDDLISVFLAQFQNPNPAGGITKLAQNDVNYDGAIDISDLVITFVRQFTKPAGV